MTSFAEIFISLAGDGENASWSTVAILLYFFLYKQNVSSNKRSTFLTFDWEMSFKDSSCS